MSAAIIMIHGRGPKPARQALLACWQSFLPIAARALPLDMVHWVDLFGYDPPILSGPAADCDHLAANDLPDDSARAMNAVLADETLDDLQHQVGGHAWSWPELGQVKDRALELLWRQFTTVTRDQFALDAINFFRDRPEIRTEAKTRLRAAVEQARAAGHEVLVLGHSFGTIVAYETLRELQDHAVHTLITMGSPLAWCYDLYGPAAPAATASYLEAREFPRFGLRYWWNVYDPADLVATAKVLAGAPQIASIYRSSDQPVIIDAPIANTYARPNDAGSPHDYRGYLTSQPVRRAIRLFMLETA